MIDIVERLREVGIHLADAIAGYRDDNLKRAAMGAVEIARVTQEAADTIERLSSTMRPPYALYDGPSQLTILALEAEIVRLRAALREIITEADSDDGLTAWDGADIARRALEP